MTTSIKPDWDQIESDLRDVIYDFEFDRAAANYPHGRGLWCYLRAYIDRNDCFEVAIGCEASPCYPESEYYSRGEFPPCTFRSVQEHCNDPIEPDLVELDNDAIDQLVEDALRQLHESWDI